MGIKTQFSIKDLEHLSGIKAHTIRIWEKRYNLLRPERTDTNIRSYSLENLMKLLNVTYLYNQGVKISKIAKLNNAEIESHIKEMGLQDTPEVYAVSEFKSSMLHFDPQLFHSTFNRLEKQYSFREIFFHVFIPLLNDIGLLWQTGTIDPSHERFISEHLKQKLIVEIEKASSKQPSKTENLFVLFLPLNEIHEIGLLYVNYELLSNGHKTIYLGNNIPTENLSHLMNHHDKMVFVSYLTVQPEKENLSNFITHLNKTISENNDNKVWLFGSQIINYDLEIPSNIKTFSSLSQFINEL
ncbi:MerR family transcriptional regulator [uncultured Planktosalinus sp.]|uniref:MerR family transcriptional regulator n=1 Tax=uncultured Planktosalinus sp. TaxID=1810935 RepID=UPI0030DB8BC0|tara:strand:- start:466 stop:1359 length:894 start_codon:yes stop_codon:yes gene_type:complete